MVKLWDKIWSADLSVKTFVAVTAAAICWAALMTVASQPHSKITAKDSTKQCICVPGSCRCCKGCTRTGWPLDDSEIVKAERLKRQKYRKPQRQWLF